MSKKVKVLSLTAAAVILVGTFTALNARSFAKSDLNNAATSTASNDTKKLVDETVYIFTTSDGTVRKIISSDWTKNLDVDEYTSFKVDANKSPIDMNISYLLDGEDISAKDIAGRSGKVTMRLSYTNKEMAGGYYVPYAVLAGIVLDNEHFSNVEVANAKLINDGTRTIIAGVALPGMQENLGVSGADLEIPSYIEWTADVKDFTLDMTVSVATSEIFNNIDVSKLDTLDQLEAELNKMSSAMNQLVGGSSELAQGIETLYQKASALPSGIEQLYSGSKELSAGTALLNAGIAELETSIKTKMQAGVNQIVGENYANSKQLVQGLSQLVETTISTALDQYNPAFSQLLPIFEATGYPATALTRDNYATNLAAWTKAMDDAQVQAALAYYAPGQNPAVLKAQFTTMLTKLSSADQLLAGVKSYTAGVNQLAAGINGDLLDGVNELKTGSTQLAAGAEELSAGISTLNDSAPVLVSGINQLRDGSTKLSSGLKQFNEEAVQKLISFYRNDVKTLANKIRDIVYIARNHSSNVKYIYRSDAIKK